SLASAFTLSITTESRRNRRIYWAIFAGIALLLASNVLTYSAVQSGRDTRAQIADCVKPGGACYKRSQKATADAIAAIEAQQVTLTKQAVTQAICDVDPTRCPPGVHPTH